MKLQLLHGPANAASRRHLIDLKKKFDQSSVIVFETEASIEDVLGSLMTVPLISEERLIVWENPSEDLTFNPFDSSAVTLILWFDHEVSEKKSIMEWVKKSKGQVWYFPEGKEITVFPFLDLLALSDKKAYLEIDKLKKGGVNIFYLITMIYYLLRNLMVTPKNAPDFVRKKLIKQKEKFNMEKIKNLYKNILETEFKLKKGLLEDEQAKFSLVDLFTH